MEIRLKRAYDPPSDDDGIRVLTERLWPRGLSKERAQIDRWAKDWAPSSQLRKWYSHDEEKWSEFQRRYRQELELRGEAFEAWVRSIRAHHRVTFVFGSKGRHVSSVVLREVVMERLGQDDRGE